MDSEYTEFDSQVKITPYTLKRDQRKFERKHLIIGLLIIVVLAIVLGVILGVVLKKDDSSRTLQNRLAEYPVILISLDGFRTEYLTRNLTPNITKLGKTGVQAKFLLSQFPTKTFPNHYSIVTGLYPESHGIVFNSFYDPVLRKQFTIPKSRNPAFWSGEPIWITAKKNGMKTASYFWVGSEVEGLRPTYYRVYNSRVPFSDRVEQVLNWLRLPEEERPSFITLYFNQPDSAGHRYGPDSDAVNEQLKIVDDVIGQLLSGLGDMNMTNSVNLVLVSDHGMSATNCSQAIFLDKYGVLENEVYWTNLGSVVSFRTKRGVDEQKILDKIKCLNSSFQAFYKKDLPKRMHFSNNKRIDDIIVIGDPGELISINSTAPPRNSCEYGSHGYDAIAPSMQNIFMARGPSFKKGKIVEHFSNIEIYNLLAALLKIKPAPNNGTMGSLNELLTPEAMQNVSEQKGDGNIFRTDICQFPNDKIFAARTSKHWVCYFCKVRNNITELDKVFNITSKQAKAYQAMHLPWGIPEGGAGVEGCLMTQPGFIIGYSTHLRIPLWTANRLNGSLSKLFIPRKDCFRLDVRLMKNQSGSCRSYTRSGFDRGHLVPNSDLDYDIISALSSFTFANIAPQYPKFNRGIWRNLEILARKWALKYEVVHVISGSIFDGDENGIRDDDRAPKKRTRDNPDNPAVPTHFYKIITRCDPSKTSEYNVPGCGGSLRVISFILRNTNEVCSYHETEKILTQNVARVKDIELLTGINFFSNLPKQLQTEIETFLPVELWS